MSNADSAALDDCVDEDSGRSQAEMYKDGRGSEGFGLLIRLRN